MGRTCGILGKLEMYSIPLYSETCQGKNRLVSGGRKWDDNFEMDRRPKIQDLDWIQVAQGRVSLRSFSWYGNEGSGSKKRISSLPEPRKTFQGLCSIQQVN
jgi:hypothetical protein